MRLLFSLVLAFFLSAILAYLVTNLLYFATKIFPAIHKLCNSQAYHAMIIVYPVGLSLLCCIGIYVAEFFMKDDFTYYHYIPTIFTSPLTITTTFRYLLSFALGITMAGFWHISSFNNVYARSRVGNILQASTFILFNLIAIIGIFDNFSPKSIISYAAFSLSFILTYISFVLKKENIEILSPVTTLWIWEQYFFLIISTIIRT